MTDPAGQQQVRPGLLIALGVVAGLGALAALWVFVVQPLLAPDEVAEPPDVDVDVDVTVEPTPSPTVTDEVIADDDVPIVTDEDLFTDEPFPETFEIFTARDPFQQLVQVVEAPTAAPGTPGAPTPPTQPSPSPSPSPAPSPTTPGTPTELPDTNGDDDDGGAPPTPVQPGGGTGQPGTMQPSGDGTSTTQVGQTTIHLVDVFVEDGQPMVLVEVNGTVHEAGEGDVFAQRFQVLDIAGDCATFLFGDSRFMLCEGEEIRK